MKITDITVERFRTTSRTIADLDGHGHPAPAPYETTSSLTKIHTDEGLTGVGELALVFFGGPVEPARVTYIQAGDRGTSEVEVLPGVLGERSRTTVSFYNIVAVVRSEQGRYAEAEARLREALVIEADPDLGAAVEIVGQHVVQLRQLGQGG